LKENGDKDSLKGSCTIHKSSGGCGGKEGEGARSRKNTTGGRRTKRSVQGIPGPHAG